MVSHAHCAAASLTSGFLIMLPVARATSVLPVALSLMSSLSVALAVDYNLFFLARWREEVVAGRKVRCIHTQARARTHARAHALCGIFV